MTSYQLNMYDLGSVFLEIYFWTLYLRKNWIVFGTSKSWIPITYLKCLGRQGLVWPNLYLMTWYRTRQSARFISADCANITPTIAPHQPHVPTPAPPPAAAVAWNARWLLARNLPTEQAGWGEVTQACRHQLLLRFMKNLSHVTTLKVLPSTISGCWQ